MLTAARAAQVTAAHCGPQEGVNGHAHAAAELHKQRRRGIARELTHCGFSCRAASLAGRPPKLQIKLSSMAWYSA